MMKKGAWSEPVVACTFFFYSAATVLILLWNLVKAESKYVTRTRPLHLCLADKQNAVSSSFEGDISFWIIPILFIKVQFILLLSSHITRVFTYMLLSPQQNLHIFPGKKKSMGKCLQLQFQPDFYSYTKSRYCKTSAVAVWQSLKRHKSLSGRSQPNSAE